MTNSYRDYKQNFINNLPSGVTYDSDLGRFFFNGKKFYTAQSVVWYREYILKYDPSLATPANAIVDRNGTLVVDRNGAQILTRA